MKPIIEEITNEQIVEDRDHFKVGDGVRVYVRVHEGGKERIQVFAGIVIARKGRAIQETFTVRRIGARLSRPFASHREGGGGSEECDHAGPHVLSARPRGQEGHQGQGVATG